jgi:protein phosphatase
MRVQLAWATDPGLQREENEDSVLVWRDRAGVEALLVVCDGMGGHAAGHLASSIAAETISSSLSRDGKKGVGVERLEAATADANTAVHASAQQNPAWTGMGSTMTVVAIDGGNLGLINIGDSPAYLFRDGGWKSISEDHSWPAEQVRIGVLSEEEARDHPLKHRLTRAVGVWEQIQGFTDRMKLRAGDTIVICTDGVETAGVSVEEMWALIKGSDLKTGIKRVIDRCRVLGAPDNITLAVARLEPDEQDTVMLPKVTARPPKPRA